MSDQYYEVVASQEVRERIKSLIARAREMDQYAPALESLKWIVEELRRTPLEFGESREYLEAAKLRVRVAFVGPFLVGFGAGPRICLGKSFALLQLRVMTTTIVRRYRIERVAQGSVMPLPTLRPNGSMVRFIARENSRAGAPSSREQSPAGATSAS